VLERVRILCDKRLTSGEKIMKRSVSVEFELVGKSIPYIVIIEGVEVHDFEKFRAQLNNKIAVQAKHSSVVRLGGRSGIMVSQIQAWSIY
jgi:hypothetical protein